jgi:hypothetical protein
MCNVIANENTPLDILEKIAKITEESYSMILARNPKITPKIIDQLIKTMDTYLPSYDEESPKESIWRGLLHKAKLTEKHIVQCLKYMRENDTSYMLKIDLYRHKKTPSWVRALMQTIFPELV